MFPNHLSAPALFLASAILAGCAVGLAGCADSNPARDLAVMAGVTGGEPKPAPDFVSQTRRGGTDYMPVGVSAPTRPLKSKSAAEVTKVEGELDQTRTRVDARGAELRRTKDQ